MWELIDWSDLSDYHSGSNEITRDELPRRVVSTYLAAEFVLNIPSKEILP